MKKHIFILSTLLLLPGSGFSMGNPPEGVSLLLVPARPAMVQVGMDMAERGHALLMTYSDATSPEELFLHLWDGHRWLRVSAEKYRKGDFIRNRAANVLVVGDESDITAGLIEQGLTWSPEVLHLGSRNVTELINQMGKLYEFNRREWEWVAKRYNLALEDVGAETEPISWYDSNRASTLPPAERPWQKQPSTSTPAPQTSLTPMMPPSFEREVRVPVQKESSAGETRSSPSTSGDAESASEGPFRLELEP